MRHCNMRHRSLTGAATLVVALLLTVASAVAFDDSKYPNWNGQWRRFGNPGLLSGVGGIRYDDSLPPGPGLNLGQKPPLTPEYQSIYDENLEDMAKGGQGIDPTSSCVSPGLPRVMIPYLGFEIVITPGTTYLLMERDHDFMRRVYTDGRDYPPNMDDNPQFLGYSIGQWRDEDGDGRYDTLLVETRGLKGPRVYDATGIPLHADNQSIIKERLYLDKDNPNRLHNEITTIDHALTRPWTVTKTYQRTVTDKPIWYAHAVCGEGNNHVQIGKEHYFRSAEGLLMPTKKDQPAPDLRYFKPAGR